VKTLAFTLLALVMVAPALVRAHTRTDLKAVRQIPQDFCDAWAKHDGHALAKIMADDVDFVTAPR
jgi:ketosteroid isomerase-like protein